MESTIDLSRALGGVVVNIDYSILAVVVVTLGLILIAEILRHQLEKAAKGRIFLHAVLESVYRELSTLGVVEAGIYLLHSYYDGLDVEKEKVFAKVHFFLFFTAVINALQTCILAVMCSLVSDRMWRKTEALDVMSYVNIRENFDRLETKLQRVRLPASSKLTNVLHVLQVPSLMYQRHQLRLQVRFHELRLHFINSNQLPVGIHISDYLNRCEVKIFSELCHTSTLAWILLTGVVNISYFLLGMTIYVSEADERAASGAMIQIYIWGNVFIVVISLLLLKRMTYILSKIISTKIIDSSTKSTTKTFKEFDQKGLFWGGDPQYIVSVVQFVQFVSSMSMSILLIFWNTVIAKEGLAPYYLILTVCTCYFFVVTILAYTIPRFIMCANLGQQINQDTLHETVAYFRWQEAKRVLEREAEATTEVKNPGSTGSTMRASHTNVDNSKSANLAQLSALVQTDTVLLRSSLLPSEITVQRLCRQKSVSDSALVAMMRAVTDSDLNTFVPAADVEKQFQPCAGGASKSKLTCHEGRHVECFAGKFLNGDDEEENQGTKINAKPKRERQKSSSLGVDVMRKIPLDEADDFKLDDLSDDEEMQVKVSEIVVSVPGSLDEEVSPVKAERMKREQSFTRTMEAKLDSRQYQRLSCLFGTMPCFVFVGMRVEGFLVADGSVPTPEKTFQLPLAAAFWLEVTWLCSFLLISSLMLSLNWFRRKDLRVAACVDFGICSLCLSLLMVAESRRYCSDDQCSFGSRSEGSIGVVEPFTSIILLRLLRFYVGRRVVGRDVKEDEGPSSKAKEETSFMLEKHGTIIDLWQHAIALYPDIVDTRGEFSGELLRAMLGLVVDSKAIPQPRSNEKGSLVDIDP